MDGVTVPSMMVIRTGESPIAAVHSRTVRWDISSFNDVQINVNMDQDVDFGLPESMMDRNFENQSMTLSKDTFSATKYRLSLCLRLAKDMKVKHSVTISSGEPRVERRLQPQVQLVTSSIISSLPIEFDLTDLGTVGTQVRRTNHIRFDVNVSIVSERVSCSRLVSPPGPTLAKSLGACLVSDDLKELSDVDLIDRDGGAHPAHRFLLSVRSPVLRATFRHDMQESLTGRVPVEASSDAVEQLLKFIYTDEIANLRSNEGLLVEVFSLGSLYTLPRLTALAEMQMKDTLTVNNVSGRLLITVRHNSPLMKDCMETVRCNMSAVVKTEGWAEITKDATVMAALMSSGDSCDDDCGQSSEGGRRAKKCTRLS